MIERSIGNASGFDKINQKKVIGEVINSDSRKLKELVEANINIDFSGQSGESPLHIVVYKNNFSMLRILIDSGVNPNLANRQGDTAFHIAARIGSIEGLTYMYNCGRCDLTLQNKDNQTALDIAESNFEDNDLVSYRLFSPWRRQDSELSIEIENIINGRKKCFDFLREKMEYDKQYRSTKVVDTITSYNFNRNQSLRICHGLNHFNMVNINYSATLNYPPNDQNLSWTKTDIRYFDHNKNDVLKVLRVVFTCDYVDRNICQAFNRSVSYLLNEKKMKKRFFK
eukprot:gene14419-19350_t